MTRPQLPPCSAVAIWADGDFPPSTVSYQARCMTCGWKSRWFRSEERAVEMARDHWTDQARRRDGDAGGTSAGENEA